MSPAPSGGYAPSPFWEGFQRQVAEDHARARERGRQRNKLAQAAPSLVVSGLLGPDEPASDAEYERLLGRMTRELTSDPLVQRYSNHLLSGYRNTEWWHAVGHRQLAALQMAGALTREQFAQLGDDASPIDKLRRRRLPQLDPRLFANKGLGISPPEIRFEWTGRLLESMPYLWSQHCYDAATAAPLVPHVVQPNAMPYESLFFSFENVAFAGRAEFSQEPSGPTEVRTETWFLHVSRIGDAGMMCVFDMQMYPLDGQFEPQSHLVFQPIPFGARWPETFEHGQFGEIIASTLRMLAFMQAPFVDALPARQKLPRPIRREYERAKREAPEPAASVIILRRALHEPVYVGGTEAQTREWKHSWWVSGHYRWQYYPSEQQHRLIAIAPFIKQAGKPMLPRVHMVER